MASEESKAESAFRRYVQSAAGADAPSMLPGSELDALRWIFESGCGPTQIAKSPGETFANVVARAKLEQMRVTIDPPWIEVRPRVPSDAQLEEPLPRIAAALERLAESFTKKDQRFEKAAAESWEAVRLEPLSIEREDDPPACIFCAAKSPRVTRGPLILGCVACFSAALRPLEP